MIRKLYVCVGLLVLVLAVAAHPAWAQNLSITGNPVAFFVTQGNNPVNQSVYIYPSTGLNPTIKVSTANGGDWLSVLTVTTGFFGETFEIACVAKSQALPIGDYFGQVTVSQPGVAQFPLIIPVTLRVNPPGAYLAPSPDVINLSVSPGNNAPSTALTFRNVGMGQAIPAFSKTSTGGDWIVLSAPIASTLSPDVHVLVNYSTSSLAPGFYSGVITGTASSALNSPVNVPVNLKVGAATQGPLLAASPTALSFIAAFGASPAAQTIALNNSGQGSIDPLVESATADGGTWLNVTWSAPGTGGARTLTVSVNSSTLARGSYSGTITIIDTGTANSPLTIPITLSVRDPFPVLFLKSRVVGISVASGGPKQTISVDVSNAGIGTLSFTAASITQSGGNWLSVTPTSGTAPATLTITADPTGLAAGVYQGKVTITVPNAGSGTNSPQDINVILGVDVRLPTINANGMVNGASFATQTLAPGEIASAFGLDLGPAQGVSTGFVNGKLPSQLAGVSVTFDGIAAPLFYVDANQINVQVPFEVAGRSSTQVQVTTQTAPGPAYVLNLRAADPGIFKANGRMTVFNQANQQILPGQPAVAGDVLTMYATGLGALSATLATGAPAPSDPPLTTATKPVITIGGQAATILFAGGAPGFVGLYQINFVVPLSVVSGDQPLILSVGTAQSAPQPLAVK